MADLPFAVLPLPLGSLAANNERTARPAAHLAQLQYPGMVWRADTNGGAAWVKGSLPTASSVDFIALIGTNAGFSTTVRVRLGATVAGIESGTTTHDSGAMPFIYPPVVSDTGRYHSHLALAAAVTASAFRIDIGGHSGDFEAAALVIGKRRQPANFYASDFRRGVEDLGSIDLGRWGVPEETPGAIFRRLSLRFGWMSEAEMETMFRPMVEQLGRRGVAYWCFDPAPTAYRQARTYMGWLREPAYATGGAKPGRYEMEFDIVSMI